MGESWPGKVGLAGYALFCAGVFGYAAIAGEAVFWAGLALMLALYGAFFYLGAIRSAHRGGTLAELMLAGRQLPLPLAAFSMTATWVGGGYVNGTAEYAYSTGLL